MNTINTKQHGKSFQDIYGTSIYEVYKDTIDIFFDRLNQGKILDSHGSVFTRSDGVVVSKGFIWVAHHGHFETLTIEPLDGGQYEIAVRFPHPEGKWATAHSRNYKYCGYSICSIPYVIIGRDTGGH